MNEELRRPWHTDFDLEFFEWEEKSEEGSKQYKGIVPVHVCDPKWKVDVGAGAKGKVFRGYRKTLAEAVELRDHFRSINQRAKQ